MFEDEIKTISSDSIRKLIRRGISILPDYFYHIPASSTGKYHPQYALGNGGLYRHVKATIIIANELFRMKRFTFSKTQRDLIIGSLILHDGWKQGLDTAEGYTAFEHPKFASAMIWKNIETTSVAQRYYLIVICLNILSHMGQWNSDKKKPGKYLLPPITKMQKFVHLCDFLASRRPLEINFESKKDREM